MEACEDGDGAWCSAGVLVLGRAPHHASPLDHQSVEIIGDGKLSFASIAEIERKIPSLDPVANDTSFVVDCNPLDPTSATVYP